MNAGSIHKFIIGLVILVLAIILGSLAAGDLKDPVVVIGGFGLLFLLNVLGRRAWILIFIAPPLISQLPLGALSKISPAYLVGAGVLAYSLILSMMGYMRLKWRSVPLLDLTILIIFIMMLAQFIRNPVGLNALGLDFEMIGGKEYFICACATVFYITVSCVPIEFKHLHKILKFMIVCSLLSSLLSVVLGGSAMEGDIADNATENRFSLFMGIGKNLFILLLAFNSPLSIMFSWWKTGLLALSTFMTMLSGYRGALVELVLYYTLASYLYKQLLFCISLALACYGILFTLSETKILLDLPWGVQRTLSGIPGMDVNSQVKVDANYSLEWRYVLWNWAMDPRTGYIKNYIWGDGYGVSFNQLRLNSIAVSRRTMYQGDQRSFADSGLWHNGRIHLIHRVGYVGLVIYTLAMLIFFIYMIKVLKAYRGQKEFPYISYLLLPTLSLPIMFFVSTGITLQILGAYSVYAYTKLLYCMGQEEGIIATKREDDQRYIPLMMEEHQLTQGQ